MTTTDQSNNFGTFTPEQSANAADLAKYQNQVPNNVATPFVSAPSVITPESLQPQQSVTVPTYTPAVPAPSLNVADQILKQSQVEDTSTQKLGNDLSTKIYDLLPKLAGETQALSEAQKTAGVDVKKQELQNLNATILKKQAEMNQDDVQLVANSRAEETRDTLLPFAQLGQAKLAGDAAIIRALKSSEIGVLNAQALAKQGDIQLAMDTAKDAVAVKYAPYKEAISIYQQQLEALAPILNKDEKKQAQAQQLKTDLALKEIDKKEKKEAENLALVFSSGLANKFVNKNGEIIRASDGKSYTNAEDFLKDAGVSSFEEAYSKGLIGDLSQNMIEDRNFVSQLRSKYLDAGISLTDSAQVAAQKALNSPSYNTGESFTLGEGQVRYDSKGNVIAQGPEKPVDVKKNFVKVNGMDYLVDEQGNLTTPQVPPSAVSEIKSQALSTAQDLLNKLNSGKGTSAVGGSRIFGLQNIPGSAGKDFANTFDTLKSQLSLDNVKLLKGQGQVSDAERKLLGEASTKLNLNQSEGEFKKTLQGIIDTLGKIPDQPNSSGKPTGSAPPGEMWVKDKASGQWGSIPINEFDDSKYDVSFNKVGNTTASAKLGGATPSPIALASAALYPAGSIGGQCTTFLHKIADFPPIGDGKNQKFSYVDKNGIPADQWRKQVQVGDIVVSGDNPTYGHTFMVNAVLSGGRVQVTESNYHGNQKVTYNRIVSINDPKIHGAIRGNLKVKIS